VIGSWHHKILFGFLFYFNPLNLPFRKGLDSYRDVVNQTKFCSGLYFLAEWILSDGINGWLSAAYRDFPFTNPALSLLFSFFPSKGLQSGFFLSFGYFKNLNS